MRPIRSGRVFLFLVLLGLFCLLSVSLGEETTSTITRTTTRALEDATSGEGGGGEAEATANPTGGEVGADDSETETTGEENENDENENDDGAFDVKDLLPGLDDTDSDSFVKNYILGQPEYYTEVYNAPHMVPQFNSIPRFGHSKDFSLLVGDNPDDYFLGLLFIGTFICSFFVFWGIVIAILKCIGPKHVGFLAGFPFREEGRKSVAGRVTLSVSAWMMMIATIVLITKGLTELQALSDTVGMTNFDIQLIERDVQQIVTTLQVVSAKTLPIRDELVDFLKRDICPLEPGSDTEDNIRSVGEDTYDAMVDLDDFIEGYLNDVESGVNQTNKFTNRVKGMVDQAQFVNNPKVTAVVFPYFIVPSFILVAVCMGWFDVFSESFYTFITWVILPLLILLTAIAVVASGWLMIAAQANSDLCMPKPENTIINILDQLDLEADSSGSESKDENGPSDNFFYDIIVFYTNQCTKPNPWEFLEGHYADLARGRNILGEFLRSIEDTTLEQLSQECGHEYGPIVELLLQLQDLITILARSSIRALNLMSCRNIVPLYTTSVYEATCTMSPVGTTWVFSCTVVIAFFGMLSIMFRGAYYPIDYYYYDEKDLYPTDEESGIQEPLADSVCNEYIAREQEDQCLGVLKLMEDEKHFVVYNDNEEKVHEEEDEEDDSNISENDGATAVGTENSFTVGGDVYSIGTFEVSGGQGTFEISNNHVYESSFQQQQQQQQANTIGGEEKSHLTGSLAN
mmetsp:Transcript_19053/g.39261  ORF Transcript_19053/g.39261 Transcript_19053/m.39261 type:complete len:742 (-) Transcript_19053:417-2642(-)